MNDDKEMNQERFWALYAEYCLEAAERAALVVFGPGTPESFEEFVAWRKDEN